MRYLSKQKQREVLEWIFSPHLEKAILILFIALQSIIVIISTYKIANEQYQQYELRGNLIKYYDLETSTSNIQDYNQLYDYTQSLLTQKLWVQNQPSPFKPMGLVRMVQFRVENKDCYFEQACSPNANKTDFFDCPKALNAKECNLYYTDITKSKLYNVKVVNKTECALVQCREYEYRDTNLPKFVGFFSEYQGDSFFVDFDYNSTRTSKIIEKLKDNNWLDIYTRAVIIQWNVDCTWVDSYFIFTMAFETRGDQILLNQYKFYSVSKSDSWETIISVLYFAFFVILILLSIKLVYDFSYELSKKIVLVFEIIQLTFCYSALFTHVANTGFLNTLISYQFQNYNEFYDFQKYIILWNLQLVLLGCACTFLPFRIFQLISHFKIFAQLTKFLISVFRLTPFIVIFFLLYQLFQCSWALGFYFMFHHDVYDFLDFYESWISINFKDFFFTQEFIDFINDPFYQNLKFGIVLIILSRYIIASLFIAAVIYLYRKASSLDKNEIITPTQKERLNQLLEIKQQLDSLVMEKKNMNEAQSLDKSFKGKAIISWVLCSRSKEQQDLCQELFNSMNQELRKIQIDKNINESKQYESQRSNKKIPSIRYSNIAQVDDIKLEMNNTYNSTDKNIPQEINPLIFDKTSQLIPFLDSYFQVKPMLITTQSLYKFRIVIQNLETSSCISTSLASTELYLSLSVQQHNVTELINYLKEVGCKVPVLLYFSNDFDDTQLKFLNRLKRKYDKFYWTQDLEKVKSFCKMEQLSVLIN